MRSERASASGTGAAENLCEWGVKRTDDYIQFVLETIQFAYNRCTMALVCESVRVCVMVFGVARMWPMQITERYRVCRICNDVIIFVCSPSSAKTAAHVCDLPNS